MDRVKEKVENTKIVDATSVAAAIGNPKAANVVLLGAAVKALGLTDLDWDAAIEKCVKPKFVELNKKAFQAGLEV